MIIKNFIYRINNYFYGLSKNISYNQSKRYNKKYDIELDITEITDVFQSRTEQYLYFHHYFWNIAPGWLRNHREYFRKKSRGFGEDAFHAMWYLLFRTLNPSNVLEIGVYRGQILSLWLLLAEKLNIKMKVHGISPFSNAGDSVSSYLDNIDYYNDTVINCKRFSDEEAILHRGYSTDETMKEFILSYQWDVIYIDGCHDYHVVMSDFKSCSKTLSPKGIVVFDDAALFQDFLPPKYSSKGHPGPSKVADNLKSNVFYECIGVGHNRVFMRRST